MGSEIAHERVHVGFSRHLPDVGARRKRLLRASEHDAADLGRRLERVDRMAQVGDQRGIERIERLRAVETHDPHLAARLDLDVLVAHSALSFFDRLMTARMRMRSR